MSALLDTLNALPKELWTPLAVVFGALMAIAGVMLQNHNASKRHRRELANDAEQRRLEREADLRKLVYLEALQEFGQVSKVLRALVHTATPLDQVVDQANQAGSSGWKLYGIAGMDTIRALTAANREAAKAAERLAPVRLRYEVAKASTENFEKLLKQWSTTTPKDGEKQGSNTAGNKLTELLVGYVDHLRHMGESGIDMMLLGQDAAAKYERAVWQVIIEIRKEIGFPVDEQVFLGVMKASAEDHQQTIDSVAADGRRFFDGALSKLTAAIKAKTEAVPEKKPLEGP